MELALGTFWAINPDGLDALSTIYHQIIQRTGSMSLEDIQEVMAQNEDLACAFHLMDADSMSVVKKGRPMAGTRSVNVFDNGVALLNMFGPIFPRSSMMNSSSEGVSTEALVKDFATAYMDPDINAVVLNSDSPGGDARGLGDAADFMYKMTQKGKKPFLSFASGYMTSAAYYLSAPAHKIFASKSGMIGSIGVVSKVNRKDDGTLDIVSSISPKKRPDYNTEEGLDTVREKVNDLGNQFANDVRTYRGVTLEKVLNDYGQGDYMLAPRAKSQGLIDGVSTLGAVIEMAAQMATDKSGSSYRRDKPKAALEAELDEEFDEVLALSVFSFPKEINMGLKDMLARLTPSKESLVQDDEVQAQEATTAEESEDAAVVAESGSEEQEPTLTRDQLEEMFADAAELFATKETIAHRIVPALQGHAAADLLNAMIDDKLYGGGVNYVDAKGFVVNGTREDQVRARYSVMPPHTKTQEAIKAIKEGTLTAKVLPEADAEAVKVDGPIAPDRKVELLAKSQQGQAVLASGK